MKRNFFTLILAVVFFNCTSCSNVDSSTDVVSTDYSSSLSIVESSGSSTTTSTSTSTVTSDVETSTTQSSISTETTTKKTQATTKSSETTTSQKTTKVTTTPITETTTQTTSQSSTDPNNVLDDYILYDLTPVPSQYKMSATSLACIQMIMEYYGYSVKQSDLVKYLDINSYIYKRSDRDVEVIPDPDIYFVGDPESTTIGSTPVPIFNMLEKYLEESSIPITCDCTFDDIKSIKDILNNQGIPIVFFCNREEYYACFIEDPLFKGDYLAELVPKEVSSAVVVGILPNDDFICCFPDGYQVVSKEYYESSHFGYAFFLKK